MNRLTTLATLIAISLVQGCAHSPPQASRDASSLGFVDSQARVEPTPAPTLEASAPFISSAVHPIAVAHMIEVPVEKNAPPAEGHPLTSVVVTQCNLIVAVYLTMPDGRLLRFDRTAEMPADQLISMAYTATRSERVEVSCNDTGSVGYEHHEPL